jgi:hypothetical protein
MPQAKMTKRFDARFDEQTIRKLTRLCLVTGMTKSEVVRWLIFNSDKVPFDTLPKTGN